MNMSINRWLHRHGFGIHSPWVYAMIRDVLFESIPYYAYDELQLQFPNRSRKVRRMDEQLFRLYNYAASTPINIIGNLSDSAKAYAARGADTHGHTAQPVSEIIVVEDISGAEKDIWDKLMQNPDATATFDVGGYRGIAFLNPNLTKQHYKV